MATFRDNILFLETCLLKHGVTWSVHDIEGYTTQELLYQMCKKINETIEDANETKKLVLALRDFILGDGLAESLRERLDEMFEDGTLADIIDTQIFGNIKEEIEKLYEELETYKSEVENIINGSIGSVTDAVDKAIEELNKQVSDVIKNFEDTYNALFNFDLRYIVPSQFGQIMMKKTRVNQSIGINSVNGDMFGGRVYSDNHEGLICKFSQNGTKESSIILRQGGHMTCFGVEPVYNETNNTWDSYIWCNMDVMQGSNQTGNVIARFKYDDSITELSLNSPRVQVIETGSRLYSIPSIDYVNDLLGLIRKDNGRYWIEVFKLSEIKQGIVKKIGTLHLGKYDQLLQGFAISGDFVYWRVGTADGTIADTLAVFNWKTDKMLYEINTGALKPTRSINNETENFREPEGLCVYMHPKTKERSLFLCTSIGESNRRKHYIHAYHQGANGGVFASRLVGQAQLKAITKPDGQMLDVPLHYTQLSQVKEIGHYYLKGEEYTRFTDRPNKSTGDGHYLFVSGSKTGYERDNVQIMIRNSSNNIDGFIRLNRHDGATPWKPIFLNRAVRVQGQTRLSDLSDVTHYYLTTDDFVRMTDKPNGAPNAGYYLKNSGKDTGDSFIQTITRNSSNEPTTYIRTVTINGGSPWFKVNIERVQ